MFQVRGILKLAVVWAAWIALPAGAAPPLTAIQDVLYRADGVPFTGAATITWRSFTAPDNTSIPANVLTVKIVDGVLRLRLVPTTSAPEGAYYAVRYTMDGRTQSMETWAVPPSALTLTVKEIRVAVAPWDGAAGGGGGTGGSGELQLGDVFGLTEALNDRAQKGTNFTNGRVVMINSIGRLSGVTGASTDCVRVDGTTGACGGGGVSGMVDQEAPVGVMNGVNSVFTLGQAPSPAGSLHLYRNGILQKAGVDFTLSGNGVTFLSVSIPQSGDSLAASYRTGGQ